MFLGASAFAAIRAGLGGFDPGALALVRLACGSAVLAVAAVIRRPRLPDTTDAARIVAASLLLFVSYNLGLNCGERSVSASAARLLIAMAPYRPGHMCIGEQLGFIGAIGTLVGFAGATVVVLR